MKQSAICLRCGGGKTDYRSVCPSCGHRPEGEGLLIAWLLSDESLNAHGLKVSAERIRNGEAIRPSEKQLDKARKALGNDFSSDPGLSTKQRVALLFTSLLLTPLPGWVLWFWWRSERPRAALQSLGLSLPATALYAVGVLWVRSS